MDAEKIERLRRAHATKVARDERRLRHPQCEAWMWGRKGSPGPHRCTGRGTFGIVVDETGSHRVCALHGQRPDLMCFSPDAAAARHRSRREVPEYESRTGEAGRVPTGVGDGRREDEEIV